MISELKVYVQLFTLTTENKNILESLGKAINFIPRCNIYTFVVLNVISGPISALLQFISLAYWCLRKEGVSQ